MRSLLVVVTVLMVLSRSAAAQPGTAASVPVPPPETYTQHYGWKIALIDLAAAGTAFLALQVFFLELGDESDDGPATEGANAPRVLAAAGAIYLAGGPIIHSLHGNRTGAARSFGVRAGLPVLGYLTGVALDSDASSVSLVAVGIIAAMFVDDIGLAEREVVVTPRATPFVARAPGGGVTLGIAGAF